MDPTPTGIRSKYHNPHTYWLAEIILSCSSITVGPFFFIGRISHFNFSISCSHYLKIKIYWTQLCILVYYFESLQ